MKRLLLFVVMFLLLTTPVLFAQGLMDYVDEVRGDTLVVKDYWDMEGEANSLYQVITLDVTDVPAGRVYLLKTNGYYPLINNPTTQRPTVVMGEDNTILVNNKDAASNPPLICGYAWEGGNNTGAFLIAHDLTVKNCYITPSHQNLGYGWAFFDNVAANTTFTLDNCLMERTRWIFVTGGGNPGFSCHISNCYFVNMSGQECRRNGGVYDGFTAMNTMWVENSTHVMAQGLIYKLRANPFEKVVFNQNTFINMSNLVFLDLGYQSAMSTTNNIFINCNVQGYGGVTIDEGEEDVEKLPIGLVNVYPDPDIEGDRKILVDNNVIYWDPKLDVVVPTLIANAVNGVTTWVSQMITMNTRTQGMFDDDATYPYLAEGKWYNVLPNFTDPKDLFTDQLDNLIEFSIATSDTESAVIMPDWRLINTGPDNFIFSDYPVPVDLSYDNAELLTAATGGFPVGDLNWFPERKAEWLAQRDAIYATIENQLQTGTTSSVENAAGLPGRFSLEQNYPNPFNPTTNIKFSLLKDGDVTLKVYDALGREVATLVEGYKTAQSYEIPFDGSAFTSGVYFYAISAGDQKQVKKMILMK
ncbi:MAG TPA: T9SS type A sorting domain-containing protein [Bacteroidaceae bacterium]|nr:T9SS type A sorting domain-containing protein [Bacteroidaceae bacterium]